jgi:hypothetical protein
VPFTRVNGQSGEAGSPRPLSPFAMPDAPTHEIVLRGRLGCRLLRPFEDDFAVDHSEAGVTRMVGTVRDPSHLHGLVAYLASINAELISITPVTPTTNARSAS